MSTKPIKPIPTKKKKVLINYHFTCGGCFDDHIEIFHSFKKFEKFFRDDGNQDAPRIEINLLSLPCTLPIINDDECIDCNDERNQLRIKNKL